jgi:type IV pilus assembly protein PilQ
MEWTTRCLWLLAFLLTTGTAGAAGGALRLEKVSAASSMGNQVEIRLELSGPLSEKPISFHIDNPARIALDLPNTVSGLKDKVQKVGIGPVEQITVAEASGRSRVVVQLASLTPYEVTTEGKTVVVRLETSGGGQSPNQKGAAGTTSASVAKDSKGTPIPSWPVASQPTTKDSRAASATGGASIASIDFHRGDKGEGRLVVRLSREGIGIDIRQEGENVVVDFAETAVPEALNKRMDVSDFATPVKEVDVQRKKGGVRLVVTPRSADFEHLAYQTDNIFTLEMKPLTRQAIEAKKSQEFSGEKLSLNFQNIDIRAVLQLLADFTQKNLVASDTVNGKVTLRLKNVPWDQALSIILKSKGLAARENGNVLMVAPAEEMDAREQQELTAQKKQQELSPLKTEYIQVNYATAADFQALIKNKDNNLLSERGAVTVDVRTNTLLVQETSEKLAEIRKLIGTLDIPVRQVMIESRIVVASDQFQQQLGRSLGWDKNAGSASGALNTGSVNNPGTIIQGGTPANQVDTKLMGINDIFSTSQYLSLLPVAAPTAFNWSIGKVNSYLVSLQLTAMQQENRGEIISNPRVVTANQKKAIIERGTQIPYLQATASGAANVAFKTAAMTLSVTPQITPEDKVIMDLDVHFDAIGASITTATGANIPTINTKSVKTTVLVDNGETAVLGGVLDRVISRSKGSVPFIGQIPYLGWLFRNNNEIDNKEELLIFVTPKILKEAVTKEVNLSYR